MNFLPVGHTHEEIDAFFGVYSKHLDLNDIYTMDGMCSFCDCNELFGYQPSCRMIKHKSELTH